MYRVEGWIERVQTQYLFTREFNTLEEAREYLSLDFVERAHDTEFMQYGGYDIFEQTWKRLPPPSRIINPTLGFDE